MKLRLPLAAAATVAALAVPASALAASTPELVQGTTAGTIALTAGTGALMTTGFAPGNTASQTGALTATSTSPSWTLTAQDNGTGAGKMVSAGGPTCSGSDAQLTNATGVSVSSVLPGVTAAAPITLSGTAQTVASATNQLLAANVLTTNYSVVIPSSQIMATGCVYSQNVTYTLQ